MQIVEGVRLTDSLADVPAEVSRLRKYGVDVAYDIETTDTDPINGHMVTLAFKPRGYKTSVIDVRHWSHDDLCLLGSMLEPLFDGAVTLVGQNLKYDLSFFLAQLRLGAHKVYDVMLADQVIHGYGTSSGVRHNVRFDLASIGDRYGVEVHKEERSWFIGLDTRVEGQVWSQVGSHMECTSYYYDEYGNEVDNTDGYYTDEDGYEKHEECREVADYAMVGGHKPWDEPLPPEQIRYIRQDVSVVHTIKDRQQAAIERDGLGEVIDLEMRTVFPVVGYEYWGVSINREGWLGVIAKAKAIQDDLEAKLHMGGDGFDGLDIHILKVRNDKYQDKLKPYEEWKRAKDAFVATRKQDFDTGDAVMPGTNDLPKNWGEYKRAVTEWWYERNGKLAPPPGIKSGVNLGSWMQVRDGFNDIGIPVTGVAEENLQDYRPKHPLVGIYLDYVEARKLTTTYGWEKGKKDRAFIDYLDDHDRLRVPYQQLGADTGRMAASRIHQIPANALGKKLRENVVPAPGYVFVIADFSNIELRIVAELSGDPFLLEAFASGVDVHSYVARVMFRLDQNADFARAMADGEDIRIWMESHDAVVAGRVLVDTKYRKVAKTVAYALLYGAGIQRLALTLGTSESDAKLLLNIYHETFAGAIAWSKAQKSLLDKAKKAGETRVFAQTRSGRRRWFDIPKFPEHPAHGKPITVEQAEQWRLDQDEYRKQLAKIKLAMANHPIQGLSADITKEAVSQWHERVGYADDMRLVACIHDENIAEVRPEKAEQAAGIMAEVMMNAMRKYLHVVALGEIKPVIVGHWEH